MPFVKALPISELAGHRMRVLKVKPIETRFGRGHVCTDFDGVEFFANTSLNRLLEEGQAVPFDLEIGQLTSFKNKAGREIAYYPIEVN